VGILTMIVARPKLIKEIVSMIYGYQRILLVGCAGCATVCMSGGEKEAEILASALRLIRQRQKEPLHTATFTCIRQCDPEFLVPLDELVEGADALISMACGVGAQYLAERYPGKWVVPGLDTSFAGGFVRQGVWEERCGLCGYCILHLTGGICPVTRCAKSILNGPCGGSQNGKCEINKEMDCAWQLIYERMRSMGKTNQLMEIQMPKDWSFDRHGGFRKYLREDMSVPCVK
jgi:ferredoxin